MFAATSLVLQDALTKCPPVQVNAKFSGKTPLHCAVAAGKTAIVEALLEMGANIESEVRCGLSLTRGEYSSTIVVRCKLVIFLLCIKIAWFLPCVVCCIG